MTRHFSEHDLETQAFARERDLAMIEAGEDARTARLEGEPVPATEADSDEFDPLYHRDPDPEFDPDDREYDSGWSDDLQNRYERERMEQRGRS